MEHNAIQWVGAPSCQRGNFAFYKSVSSRPRPDGPAQFWRLGEFYFVRCGPQDPVCIAEVTLLWEDQTRRHLLASARLYFLPEDTPKGRTREHGEDEVLAVSRKMVVRVEDLVRWSCDEPAGWVGQKSLPAGPNGVHKPPRGESEERGERDTQTTDAEAGALGVRVLSFPQYCRFRSLQRRVPGGASGPALQDQNLVALGAVRAPAGARVMFCRDTFHHPALESSACFSWQFSCPSLSLRGRPRKRRGRDGKDSPTGSQPESWIDRMKENVMGSVEVSCEGSWLPHPEEQLFLDQLFTFMDRQGSPIHKVPNLGFKKIDLFLMYSVVKRLGGYKKVTNDRLWKVVYNELGGCPGSTSAATCTRRHYERLMLPYEEHQRAGGELFKVPESPVIPRARATRGRKPLPRGRRPGPKPKERRPDGSVETRFALPAGLMNGVAVKRGRGRPPGTRNKATLLAETKLRPQGPVQVQVRAQAQTHPDALADNRVPAAGRGGGSAVKSLRPVPATLLPINFPPSADLGPVSSPFLPFQPKPDPLDPVAQSPAVLLSAMPRPFVSGSLSGFSPIKGICPLDVFRSRIGIQGPAPNNQNQSQNRAFAANQNRPAATNQNRPAATNQNRPAATNQNRPAAYTLQPKLASPDGADPHSRCSGCGPEDGIRASRDSRARPVLPPLRVLPLNLDCSVQVCQLMRTRHLDPTQLQSFTRRLSEALTQDLNTGSEQALPLNLSKRVGAKRPGADGSDPNHPALNGAADSPTSKKSRAGDPDQDLRAADRSSPESGQEEPADLSSPSRIRAFLLGLPRFQVKLEEDLNGGTRIGRATSTDSLTLRTETRGAGSGNSEAAPESGPGAAELKSAGTSNREDTPCC